jgi:long-chain acyl-CoA synthetase
MITGSAPIDGEVLAFLKICIGAPMTEGYGLSESAGGFMITQFLDPCVGHVGGPMDCCKIRLKDLPEMNYTSKDVPYPRGEVQIKGSNISSGYYKRPELTKKAFDKQGWFSTGDVGMLYPNGSVRIIDRAKNIFKLAQGEYIAPEKLENIYILSPYVQQILIYGNSLKSCIIAIIVLEPTEVKKWASENNKVYDLDTLCTDWDLRKRVKENLLKLA